jgi:hypothetical protein
MLCKIFLAHTVWSIYSIYILHTVCDSPTLPIMYVQDFLGVHSMQHIHTDHKVQYIQYSTYSTVCSMQFTHLADYVQEFLPTLRPLVLGVDHQRALIQRKCLVLACLCGVRWSRENEVGQGDWGGAGRMGGGRKNGRGHIYRFVKSAYRQAMVHGGTWHTSSKLSHWSGPCVHLDKLYTAYFRYVCVL